MSEKACCAPASAPADSLPADPGRPLVCYCYEVAADAATRETYDFVRGRVAAGECWCAVRNPSGKCCLPEFREAVARRGSTSEGR